MTIKDVLPVIDSFSSVLRGPAGAARDKRIFAQIQRNEHLILLLRTFLSDEGKAQPAKETLARVSPRWHGRFVQRKPRVKPDEPLDDTALDVEPPAPSLQDDLPDLPPPLPEPKPAPAILQVPKPAVRKRRRAPANNPLVPEVRRDYQKPTSHLPVVYPPPVVPDPEKFTRATSELPTSRRRPKNEQDHFKLMPVQALLADEQAESEQALSFGVRLATLLATRAGGLMRNRILDEMECHPAVLEPWLVPPYFVRDSKTMFWSITPEGRAKYIPDRGSEQSRGYKDARPKIPRKKRNGQVGTPAVEVRDPVDVAVAGAESDKAASGPAPVCSERLE